MGKRLQINFFGMRKIRERIYAYANAEELNANIKAFNKVVGEDSPMSIDSHFYYSAALEGANPLALSSQRTIDRLADGFGWPVGNRDVYQVHDLGTHATIMLADKRLIKLAQEKARDIVKARQVINNLDISRALKDEIIFILNKEAGEIFEGIGVSMNKIIGGDWTSGSIKVAKSSQREFFQKLLKNAKELIGEKITSSVVFFGELYEKPSRSTSWN